LLVASLAAATSLVFAQTMPVAVTVTERGNGMWRGSETVTRQSVITAIDPASRAVTVRRADGSEDSVIVGQEVRNFDHLKVGDLVTLSFLQSLTFELKKGGTALRERIEDSETTHAPQTEKPMRVDARSVVVLSDVVAVNRKAGRLSLRGPERSVELLVKDKSLLRNVAVGDQVVSRFVESRLISVSAAQAPEVSK
jgi:hypothetical protein